MLFKEEQRSCAAAVSRVIVLLVSLGRKPCSDNTGAYCRARAKLSEPALRRLVYEVADACEAAVPDEWRWKSKRVGLVDGFTVSMPDTAENQEAYPQSASQKEGVGFPLLRGVVLLSLATAMARGLAVGPCVGKETGETALLRELLDRFVAGDVMLADRYFCSYFLICLLKQRGIDVVSRLHQRRTADFRRTRERVPGGWGRAIIPSIGCDRRGLTGWTRRPTSKCRPSSRCARWRWPYRSLAFAPTCSSS
jgi:hypothetical protein